MDKTPPSTPKINYFPSFEEFSDGLADFRGANRPTQGRAAADISSIFEVFLTQCWRDGNRCGRHLFHDIKHRGYTGSFSNLERLLATWRRAERPGKDKDDAVPARIDLADKTYDNAPVRDPQTGHLISPVVAATLCIKPRGTLTINQARKVDALKQGSNAFAVLRNFAMRFRGIFRSRATRKLEDWIDDAIHSGSPPTPFCSRSSP